VRHMHTGVSIQGEGKGMVRQAGSVYMYCTWRVGTVLLRSRPSETMWGCEVGGSFLCLVPWSQINRVGETPRKKTPEYE
jgi:hypothetical protein